MKYTFTGETMEHRGEKLHRIQACRDIEGSGVKKGDLGGWIQSEKNLSQDGISWVFNDGKVFGNAQVFDGAQVLNDAQVFGSAKVFSSAQVSGDSAVYCNAKVAGNAQVYDNACVSGSAKVVSNAQVFGEAMVYGDAHIGEARVFGDAQVFGKAKVFSGAQVPGGARVSIDPVVIISGYPYPITICDNLVVVGCQARTLEEWQNFEPDNAADEKVWRNLYPTLYPILRPLAELHQSKIAKEAE